MIIVLDACAMIAYLRNEEGADVIEQHLLDANSTCYAHAINVCELYYDFLRVSDQATALAAVHDLQNIGIIVSEDLDSALWQAAGSLKATQRLSLADCFALAFANRLGGQLLTSDHHEFDPIQTAGLAAILFFR
ncbi:MAG: type II toxin-antitoxin system VapC family toxin [Caldilineaceae bacterium]|nr:type II toxin-antitoxin system VapC family toxin [Caldilineaceae bacterium]